MQKLDIQIARKFINDSAERGYKRVQQKTIRKRLAYATTDFGTLAKKDIFAAQATDSDDTLSTQEPKIVSGQSVPGDVRVMLFAMAVITRITRASAITLAQGQELQEALDASRFVVSAGGLDLIDLAGWEYMDYGPNFMAGGADNAAGAADDGRAPMSSLRNVCFLDVPLNLTDEKVPSFFLNVTRATAWPVAFTTDCYFKTLICRKN